MKILVVGVGKMGMLHAATLRMLPGVEGVVMAEHSPVVRGMAAAFAPDARIVADHRELPADPSIRAAVIATPTSGHAALYSELAPKLEGVFVEKPFAASAAQAREAIAACPPARRGATRVGHCLRFAAPFAEAARLLGAGALGAFRSFDVSMFSSDMRVPARSWRAKPAAEGGGVLLDLGSHAIDMARSVFGMPASLSGRTDARRPGTAEDRFESTWSYAGFSGTVRGSWCEPNVRKVALRLSVVGENGTLESSDDGVEFELAAPAAGLAAGCHRRDITELERAVPFDLAGPMYTRQLEAWLGALHGQPGAVNTLEESLDNLRLVDAIRASDGRAVTPEPGA